MRSGALAGAVLAAFGLLAPVAAARPAKKAAARPAARKAPAAQATQAKERTPSPAAASAGESGSGSAGSEEASPTPGPAAAGGTRVKSKTYSFGAMDVEGKLKTPQLLYFLNRVKLELDMSAPDKRSFMKELQQSADDKNL